MSKAKSLDHRSGLWAAVCAVCFGMLLSVPVPAMPLPDGVTGQAGQQLATLQLQGESSDAVLAGNYTQTFVMKGGMAPYRLTASGDLPPGLSWMQTDTGAVLSGKPTKMGTFSFRLLAKDASGQMLEKAVTIDVGARPRITQPVSVPITEAITISDADLVLLPVYVPITEAIIIADDNTAETAAYLTLKAQLLPDGKYGSGYLAKFQAEGGIPPYVFSTIGGNLPPGLTLAADGTLSGTFTSYGSFGFTVNVTDSVGTYSPREFSIQVGAGTTGTQEQTFSLSPTPVVTYANTSFSLSGSASSGLPLVYNVLKGPATGHNPFTVTGTGLVLIQISQPGNSTWKAISPTVSYLFIMQAPVIVTPKPQTRAFETANPDPSTYTYDFKGFVKGEDASVVSGSILQVDTPALLNSPAGEYPTTPDTSPLFATNYYFQQGTGTLTVQGGASQSILFLQPPNILVSQNLHLAAFSTSGLPVTYSVSGPAKLTGNYVQPSGPGTITVTAMQAGNATYTQAPSVSRSFTAQ